MMKICFAGTIVGLVMALSLAGKFLISQNLATMLYFATSETHIYAQDLTVVAILVLSNVVIWRPIKKDFDEIKCSRRTVSNESAVSD